MTTKTNDRAALERCMKAYPDKDHQQDLLRDRSWHEVAEYCSYSLQFDALELQLWQTPPALLYGETADTISPDDAAAFKILQRLKKAGISIFEPDPLAALKRS